MTNKALGSLGALLMVASLASAQTAEPPTYGTIEWLQPRVATAADPSPDTKPAPSPAVFSDPEPVHPADDSCPRPRFWSSLEYLFWQVRTAPVSVPLVTANPDPTKIGALNESGTTILYGAGSSQSTNFGNFNGGRVTVGAWLTENGPWGLESSGFLTEERTLPFSAFSDGATNLSLPFTATQPFAFNMAGPTALVNGGAPNIVTAQLNSRLWGAESNFILSQAAGDHVCWTGLFGFRYLDLLEELGLNDSVYDSAIPGGVVSITDGFRTRNQFYGAQFGTRLSLIFGRFNVDGTVKVAFGENHQSLDIIGSTTVANGAFGLATGTTNGGLFAQSTNIGRYTRDDYAFVPEAQLRVGYAITHRIQTFVGYNFLYLSDSLRPGNQVSSSINPSQIPVFNPAGTLTGPPAPLAVLQSSPFWAQGVSLGLEFKF